MNYESTNLQHAEPQDSADYLGQQVHQSFGNSLLPEHYRSHRDGRVNVSIADVANRLKEPNES